MQQNNNIQNNNIQNNNIQNIKNIEKTQEIIRIIDHSQRTGIKSLEMLNNQYEQLQKINKNTDNINENLAISSSMLGRIKYFFFPTMITNLDKNSKLENIDKNSKLENIDKEVEPQINNDLQNFNEINNGLHNLKNIAISMNNALDRDRDLLNKVNIKSEIVNSNIIKINKDINTLLK
jgi:hypothetical protein